MNVSELIKGFAYHDAKAWEAFDAKVVKKGKDDCWGWTGAKASGYPIVHSGIKTKTRAPRNCYTHHLQWMRVHGTIGLRKDKYFVRTCFNAECINPAHIELMTFKQRQEFWRANANLVNRHALSAEQAEEIKTKYKDTPSSRQMLADEYKVSPVLIDTITKGKSIFYGKEAVTPHPVKISKRRVLTNQEIVDMRNLRAQGESLNAISEFFNISLSMASLICARKRHQKAEELLEFEKKMQPLLFQQ
jgi:hypothetical protein